MMTRSSKFSVLSGPNILFESRISELEAQLAQTNIDYTRTLSENAELKRKRAFGGGDSAVDNSCSEAYKKQIENLQRDKSSLEDMVKKLQSQVTELKSLDAQVFSKTQRNRDLVQHADFQKTQADIEIRRLKVRGLRVSKSMAVNACKLNCRMNWSVSTNACESCKSKRLSELRKSGTTPTAVTLTRHENLPQSTLKKTN